MISVGIHPPRTPVTTGSNGIAKATLPNICKMPGPPAPFVPTPLPNIAKSGLSPKDYSKTVLIEGCTVAIRGATFESIGDMASKGTGGGLLSANTHGPAKFITPGSMTVKFEGKSVHLLGEPMLNNCGPNGSPPNTGATMKGVDQAEQKRWDDKLQKHINDCDKEEDEKYGPAANDCEGPCPSGETWTNPKTKLVEPKPNKIKLGELKEKCVYRKMGYEVPPEHNTGKPKYGESKSNADGNSVTIQKRFNSDGSVTQPGESWVGTIVPDIIYANADGSIAAVRDLKFRCPKGVKEHKDEKAQMEKYKRILKAPTKIMQPR